MKTVSNIVSGINLTLSNPAPSTSFGGDSLGLIVDSTRQTMDLTVTGGTILFKSYSVSYIPANADVTFSMSGGSGTSTGNSLTTSTGTFTANGNWQLAPGQTGKLTGTINNRYGQMQSWTFDAAI
jgi:hypothetical protein